MSSVGSPVSVPNSTLTPAASTTGRVAMAISSSASVISPRPISTRPTWPGLLPFQDRCRITPTKISSGDSHDRSSENTCTMMAVPTLAPSMMASAGATAIRPWPTKELTMTAVALLLWTRPVTPRPAAKAVKRLEMLEESTWRRLAPYTRRMPTLTMLVPHTSSATPESK